MEGQSPQEEASRNGDIPSHPPLASRESSMISNADSSAQQPSYLATNVENNRILLDKLVLNSVRALRRYVVGAQLIARPLGHGPLRLHGVGGARLNTLGRFRSMGFDGAASQTSMSAPMYPSSMQIQNTSDQRVRVRMRSNLGDQLHFQTENENLVPEVVVSYGPHLNGLFNLIGYVEEVVLEPNATQDIGRNPDSSPPLCVHPQSELSIPAFG